MRLELKYGEVYEWQSWRPPKKVVYMGKGYTRGVGLRHTIIGVDEDLLPCAWKFEYYDLQENKLETKSNANKVHLNETETDYVKSVLQKKGVEE